MTSLAPMPDLGLDVDMPLMDMDLSIDPNAQGQSQSFNPPYPSQQQLQTPEFGQAMGAGAGPLPTGFGAPSNNPTGSTLTEFTKRRNWSQRVLEEMRDLLHILTPDGRIIYVSPACKSLTGYDSHQLVGQILRDYIHPDDCGVFMKEFNESIASSNPLRFFYRFRKEDGNWTIFEAHGHPHLSNEPPLYDRLTCRGFFLMARPYPTKNAALLDSFLEHKIENERLMKRIAELKAEEQEELEEQDRQWASKAEGRSMTSDTPRTETFTESDASSFQFNGMPPPPLPGVSNSALTRQNLEEVASKSDSINDKMARYEGATHLETIEMLTGLRYRDGERSKGISTGDASPLLIRGDAGIQISIDRDGRSSADKKKKLKIADEYVCTDCGTLDSPEWRKGPNGPKTLCNACGCKCCSYGVLRRLPVFMSITNSLTSALGQEREKEANCSKR